MKYLRHVWTLVCALSVCNLQAQQSSALAQTAEGRLLADQHFKVKRMTIPFDPRLKEDPWAWDSLTVIKSIGYTIYTLATAGTGSGDLGSVSSPDQFSDKYFDDGDFRMEVAQIWERMRPGVMTVAQLTMSHDQDTRSWMFFAPVDGPYLVTVNYKGDVDKPNNKLLVLDSAGGQFNNSEQCGSNVQRSFLIQLHQGPVLVYLGLGEGSALLHQAGSLSTVQLQSGVELEWKNPAAKTINSIQIGVPGAMPIVGNAYDLRVPYLAPSTVNPYILDGVMWFDNVRPQPYAIFDYGECMGHYCEWGARASQDINYFAYFVMPTAMETAAPTYNPSDMSATFHLQRTANTTVKYYATASITGRLDWKNQSY